MRAPRGLSAALAAVLATCLATAAHVGEASASTAPVWVTDGPVYAIARTADRTYIGGDFTQLALRTGPGVAFSQQTGEWLTSFPELADGEVNAVLPDGQGGYYIGGGFRVVGGLPRDRIAHILASGQVDPNWNPGADGSVRAFALVTEGPDAGTLYVGGGFGQIGGAYRPYLAALDAASGWATGWASRASSAVSSLAILPLTIDVTLLYGKSSEYTEPRQMSLVLAGGDAGLTAFWGPGAVAGATVTTIPASIAGQSAGWQPTGALVRTLALGESKQTTTSPKQLHTAAYYGTDGGLAAARLAVQQEQNDLGTIKVEGGGYSSWAASANGALYALELSGQSLYAGGSFTQIGGAARSRLAQLPVIADPTSAAGNAATASGWSPGADGLVRTLALSGTTIYAGGDFSRAGGSPRRSLAALRTDVSTDNATAWSPAPPPGPVAALAPSGSTLYAGGWFASLGDPHARSRLAAFDAEGEIVPWSPAANAPVRALAASPRAVYAGGDFTEIAGAASARLAALDAAAGSLLPGWQASADARVMALALAGETLYAGGSFTRIGAAERSYIAALDAHSGAAGSWSPGADGHVRALALGCSALYAGGSFTRIGGAARSYIAALDPRSGAATGWSPDVARDVLALAATARTVYAGGQFASIGGIGRRRMAALDAQSAELTAFNPAANDSVRALALSADAGTVYAGGSFTEIADTDRSYVAALDAQSGAASDWSQHVTETVYAVDPALYGGGAGQQGFAGFDGTSAAGYGLSGCSPLGAASLPAPSPELRAEQPKADTAAPRIDAFALVRQRARRGRHGSKRRLAFRYTLSEPATVRILIERRTVGRRVGKRCLRPARRSRARRRCAHYRAVARLTRGAAQGESTAALGRRALRPGRYRATLTATDAAGNRARPRRLGFKVTRG